MTLREYLDANAGKLVRIGCKDGRGFIYAGLITVPETEAEIAAKFSRPDAYNLPVLDVFKSFFGGDVVTISGAACGNEWIPQGLEKELPTDCPIEHYQEFAAWIAAGAAKIYIEAYLTANTSPKRIIRENAEIEMIMCEKFFESDSFALMMPHADGKDLISLLKKKARSMRPAHQWDEDE